MLDLTHSNERLRCPDISDGKASVWCCAAGTATGDVLLWTLSAPECLLKMRCSSKLFTGTVAVNRIVWSPEGNCFGEARINYQTNLSLERSQA